MLKVTEEPAGVEGSRLRPRILGDPDTLQSLSSRSLLGEWSRVLRGGEPKLSRLRRMGGDRERRHLMGDSERSRTQ